MTKNAIGTYRPNKQGNYRLVGTKTVRVSRGSCHFTKTYAATIWALTAMMFAMAVLMWVGFNEMDRFESETKTRIVNIADYAVSADAKLADKLGSQMVQISKERSSNELKLLNTVNSALELTENTHDQFRTVLTKLSK